MRRKKAKANAKEISPLLDEHQLAGLFRCSTRTLQAWRERGTGPRWLKIGGLVRYRPEAVLGFLQAKEGPDARGN